MKSEIWKSDFSKAYESGYTIEEISSFNSEAELLLRQLVNHFESLNGNYSIENKDKNLLIYLVLNELINSLYDAVLALNNGNIRMASNVFRQVMECRDIIKLIHTENGNDYVEKWFNDEYIRHSDYRRIIGDEDLELKDLTKNIYQRYSKYSHRSYSAIIDSYVLKTEKLQFNRQLDLNNNVHRKILSRYYKHLAQFILNVGLDPLEYDLISEFRMGVIMSNLLDEK